MQVQVQVPVHTRADCLRHCLPACQTLRTSFMPEACSPTLFSHRLHTPMCPGQRTKSGHSTPGVVQGRFPLLHCANLLGRVCTGQPSKPTGSTTNSGKQVEQYSQPKECSQGQCRDGAQCFIPNGTRVERCNEDRLGQATTGGSVVISTLWYVVPAEGDQHSKHANEDCRTQA